MTMNVIGNVSMLQLNANFTTPTEEPLGMFHIQNDPTFIALRRLQIVCIPVLCLFGIIGNLTSVGIFMQRSLNTKSCCMYLLTKCLVDTVFLGGLFVVWLDRVSVPWFHQHGICQMIVFITYVCGFLSVWLVAMVTLENYFRICQPHMVHSLCTPGKARVVLLVLSIISLFCYNFPLWTTHSKMSQNKTRCDPIPEYSRFNEGLTYFDTCVTLVLPGVLVSILMVSIFRALAMAYRRNKRMKRLGTFGRQRHIHFFCFSAYGRVTAMLLAVSLTFIAFHTPSHAIRLRLLIGMLLEQTPTRLKTPLRLLPLFELLYYANYVTNCLTYLIFGKTFRDLYKARYCACYGSCNCQRPEINVERTAVLGGMVVSGEFLGVSEDPLRFMGVSTLKGFNDDRTTMALDVSREREDSDAV